MIQNQFRFDDSKKIDKVKLDVKDKKILSFLSEDSRAPLTQLKKVVQLSRDSVDYRIKVLKRDNVILGFFPIIDLERFGYHTFQTFFHVDERNTERIGEFINYLKGLSHTKNVIEYTDIWNIELVSIAKSVQDYDDKLSEVTSIFKDIIIEKEKTFIIKGYNSIHLPNKFYADSNLGYSSSQKQARDINVDTVDLKILELMSKDARMTLHEMAKELKMTAEGVSYRIRRLESSNIIRHFATLLNLSALGYHFFSYMITTRTFNQYYDTKFGSLIRQHPYVIRGVKTLGRWDFIVHIVTETPRQVHDTVKEISSHFAEIIRGHSILLGYKEHYFTPFPKYVIESFS